VNRENHRVSVATLGDVDVGRLELRLGTLLEGLDEGTVWTKAPSSAVVDGVHIRSLPHETLLEQPSCLTAPVFWKWREFAWPESTGAEETGTEWRLLAALV